ncbi:hypothetical protein GCM10007079_52030 [Nocardiopsis terrae]|uniref:DUF397 domain-containing protein n=1 Tax=Nocardiopsis terrae TaxID=372655 RepID=A0ABR9HAZ7_9ACTN|nr:DUF397 domain-containing protein [Nocardiopsis terrae]MBE1456178.1 hypothetical protein [Nocardiopsis terrae]GHC98018.1 hypothetical protein GCM10007079_52030 [Nocardiopsis terrae]
MNREPEALTIQHTEPVTAPWVKASASTSAQGCVQVRVPRAGLIEVGDTKNPDGPTITVSGADWEHFLTQVIRGDTTGSGRLRAEFLPEGGFTLTDTATPNSPVLAYTKAEWDAFKLGVDAGELRSGAPDGTLVGGR